MDKFKIGDKIELIHNSSNMNYRTGIIIGFGSTTFNKYICLLDGPYDHVGSTGICVMESQLQKAPINISYE